MSEESTEQSSSKSNYSRMINISAFLLTICVLGCGGEDPVTEAPLLSLQFKKPSTPNKKFEGNDLSTYDAKVLASEAYQSVLKKEYDKAVQFQYWSVANTDGEEGLYNLACYYSLKTDVEASFYWMKIAAQKEGVDADWAVDDPDLRSIRRDSRWPYVRQYLRKYNQYWSISDIQETTLIVPAGYDGISEIPVMIGLHGMGSRAKSFVDEDYQEYADELNIAFVGVSGTVPRGPTSFVWSEDHEKDLQRVNRALREVSDRLKPAKGKLILFGFSQGAMMSAEIAARHPDDYAGAIIMSPGGGFSPATGRLSAEEAHKRQGYIVVCGAEEHPGNVSNTRKYASHMKRLNARVKERLYQDVSDHAFPPDYYEQLPSWIEFILDE
ncbi:MAG: hypothetical protein COA78_04335 [Blastopirellula sp.]|nr:MAG: hypothetical protein COA78_04335 [Blastopirellula sp.]